MLFKIWRPSKMAFNNLKPIDLNKIVIVDFPEDQYIKEEVEKKQIVGHHTVGATAKSSINTWLANPDRVGTCIVIERDGTPYQIFSSKYWAYHLKCGNPELDKHSIGVELANWGWLTLINGKFYNYYNDIVKCEVQYYEIPYGDHRYYEKYSDAQINTYGELLLLWNQKYNIPLTYNTDMWEVNERALSGTPGVWTHVSFRPKSQKTDLHPQPELITMLKTLSSIL